MKTKEISLDEIKGQIEALKMKLNESSFQTKNRDLTNKEESLAQLVKKALVIIEATYLQSKDGFIAARAAAYHEIVTSFKSLGFDYESHSELLQKIKEMELTKLPMTKSIREKEVKNVTTTKQVG